MIQDGNQEALVELESCGELLRHLPHAVDELQENRGAVGVRVVLVTMANSLK